jgi:NAD(P) transhydrogenase subunit alpha
MVIGILGEAAPETRVALIPESVEAVLKLGVSAIIVERGAGSSAHIPDSDYEKAGARIADRSQVLSASDLLIGIHRHADVPLGKALLGGLNPLGDHEGVRAMASSNITSFSLDVIPRTTRAQAMDILSSMATVAGYRAVLMSAGKLNKFFPMFMTAAGSIKPAKVLVIGAGVAGLQAIATAKRLGAVVEAFDVRQAAKEEVLSLGARFVDVEGATEDTGAGGYAVEQSEDYRKRQQAAVEEHAAAADVVICTAQIPGRTAPRIIPADTVKAMRPGSVIVDLAASTGGNCELTRNNETIEEHGVTIIGDSNLAAGLPADASKMFGKNVINFLKILIAEGEMNINLEDDLIAGTLITHQGEVRHERTKSLMES